MQKLKIKKLKHKQSGYAILYTVVIISIIMTIATGLSNSVNKELILSSVAKDSQAAFYEADMATECALLLVKTPGGVANLLPTPGTFSCGVDKDGNPISFNIIGPSSGVYAVVPPLSILNDNQPCFSMDVKEGLIVGDGTSVINVFGYSSCLSSNKRRVERSLQVKY